MGYVILLHFDAPVNPDFPTRRHYLEYAENIDRRLKDHVSGDRTRTSGIMYACYERNIGFTVARVWQDATRRDEYQLRFTRKNPLLCPICNPSLRLSTFKNGSDWQTEPIYDAEKPRYGDLSTLSPYKYRPKHRKRSNGESNRTSGSASTWREDVKARKAAPPGIQITDDRGDYAVSAEQLTEWIDRTLPGVLGGTLHLSPGFKQRQPPPEDDRDVGFDADLPY